jgi:hypothetical protein
VCYFVCIERLAAKKALGSSAVIPMGKMSAALKNVADGNKLVPGFTAAREALEKKILELQNAGSKIKNSLAQADDQISDDDYSLDPKKPDDKKKIDQAQAIFSKFFKSAEDEIDDIIKVTDELDKHVIQLKKYKGPK